MNKRKKERSRSEERIKKKIQKYTDRLMKYSRNETPPRARTPPRGPTPESDSDIDLTILEPPPTPPESGPLQSTSEEVKLTQEPKDDELDEDVLILLGEAPEESEFGPPIHKALATRWAGIIKGGLSKEKRDESKKKYLPPENCKVFQAPKLNLEAQAAVTDTALKRDKAIMAKQNQISCALTALATAFGHICKEKENLAVINLISDAGRILCDCQHQESLTRRNFIIQGLELTTQRQIKDTAVDTWLFGEGFSEKLKASKAITKTGKEISNNNNKNKRTQPTTYKPLNNRGPVTNYRNQAYRPGPQTPAYRKQAPASVPYQQRKPSQSKPTPTQRLANHRH